MTIIACSAEDCNKPKHARSWCQKHYYRWRKYGSPYVVDSRGGKARTLDEAVEHNGCLLWNHSIDSSGYGRVSIDGEQFLAHRYAYELAFGIITNGALVDHICHNRTCIKPSHLRTATRSQNNSNRKGPTVRSSTGVRNVYRSGSGFQVLVRSGGKLRAYGRFGTIEEAALRAKGVREEVFGEFAGRG